MIPWIIVIWTIWPVFAAYAGRASSDLSSVSIAPRAGDRLPLEAAFSDETGKPVTLRRIVDGHPAVVAFVDYACRNMCSAILAIAARALTNSPLVPGNDFSLVAIGLDPDLGAKTASEMKNAVIDPDSALFPAAHFLTGDAPAIARVAEAVHYRYSRDVENDQFAHAAALLVVSGDGRVTAAVRAPNATSQSLRQAIVEAREAQAPALTTFEAVRLLCYGLGPVHGLYAHEIWTTLRAGGAMIVALLFGGVLYLARRRDAA